MTTELRRGIATHPLSDAIYPSYQPDNHTRPCFAAALGAARRSGLPHGHDAAVWAVEYLRRGEGCLCPHTQVKKRRKNPE